MRVLSSVLRKWKTTVRNPEIPGPCFHVVWCSLLRAMIQKGRDLMLPEFLRRLMRFVQMVLNLDKMSRQINYDYKMLMGSEQNA